MTSEELVKTLGEPDKVSERTDNVWGMYYKQIDSPLGIIDEVHFVVKNGRIARIVKGE